jgi:hypothetical protein
MRTNLASALVLFSLIGLSCVSQSTDRLERTTWVNDKIDNCTSRLDFKTDGELIRYYCGIDESFDARYHIKGDTVFINEYHLISQAPGSSGEKEIRYVYKYVLESEKLIMVYYDDLKYPNPEIGRDDSFVFEKSK